MTKLKISFVAIALLSMWCCSEDTSEEYSFEIFVITSTVFPEYPYEPSDFDPRKFDIESANLQAVPVISSEHIINYDLANHVITIDPARPLEILQLGIDGVPFIVVANGKRCYVGTFWNRLSALRYPDIPLIFIEDLADDSSFGITPPPWYIHVESDPRDDAEVIKALKGLGLLKEPSHGQ